MKKDIPLMGAKDTFKVYNTNLVEFLEFKNMLEISEIVLVCAMKRNESRGAHYRSDKPQEDNAKYKAHTITYKENNLLHADFKE